LAKGEIDIILSLIKSFKTSVSNNRKAERGKECGKKTPGSMPKGRMGNDIEEDLTGNKNGILIRKSENQEVGKSISVSVGRKY
jgi:hypothetical protein